MVELGEWCNFKRNLLGYLLSLSSPPPVARKLFEGTTRRGLLRQSILRVYAVIKEATPLTWF